MENRLLQAKSIDLCNFLSEHGHLPVRENSHTAYYRSPFRSEANPSFSVNKIRNKWTDWGPRKHGDVIDMAEWIYGCTTAQAIDSLLGGDGIPVYHKEVDVDKRKKNIEITDSKENIEEQYLIDYLETVRHIPLEVANRYCQEVLFRFATSMAVRHFGIGIKNDLGGYVIRNHWFKGTTAPSGITTVKFADSLECNLFEGFSDYLSYVTLHGEPKELTIILNSIVFIPMLVDYLRGFDATNLFIDSDDAADDQIEYLIANEINIKDRRDQYDGFKDYNSYLQANYDI